MSFPCSSKQAAAVEPTDCCRDFACGTWRSCLGTPEMRDGTRWVSGWVRDGLRLRQDGLPLQPRISNGLSTDRQCNLCRLFVEGWPHWHRVFALSFAFATAESRMWGIESLSMAWRHQSTFWLLILAHSLGSQSRCSLDLHRLLYLGATHLLPLSILQAGELIVTWGRFRPWGWGHSHRQGCQAGVPASRLANAMRCASCYVEPFFAVQQIFRCRMLCAATPPPPRCCVYGELKRVFGPIAPEVKFGRCSLNRGV